MYCHSIKGATTVEKNPAKAARYKEWRKVVSRLLRQLFARAVV